MSTSSSSHPTPDQLADFVAGQHDRAMRVLIETHLAACPVCCETVGELGQLGARWLTSAPPARPQGATWARLSAQLGQPDVTESYPLSSAARCELGAAAGGQPRPLRWRRLPFSHGQIAVLDGDDEDGTILLLGRVGAGRTFPRHRHLGVENVVVIEGGYQDDRGHWEAGSWAEYPPGSEHAPLADTDGPCVVLARLAGGSRFTGLCGLALALRRAAVPRPRLTE